MSNPAPLPQTMERLAFIRLLYQQALTQSRQPAPLSYTSILTFHDAVELFMVLAADTLGTPLPRRDPNFLEWFQILRRPDNPSAGVSLPGQPAMDRLNRYRNALKHVGAFPGREAVAEASASVTAFFDSNTPLAFGLEFAAIDMADVVPQEPVRNQLKAAAAAEMQGDRKEAMALLWEAFQEMFRLIRYGSRYSFGQSFTSHSTFTLGVSTMISTLSKGAAQHHDRRSVAEAGRKLDQHLKQLTDVVSAMQQAMRVVAMGIDFGQYTRFEQLTPVVSGADEYRHVSAGVGYAPTREEYDDCMQFVISAALRMAELEAQIQPPSWKSP